MEKQFLQDLLYTIVLHKTLFEKYVCSVQQSHNFEQINNQMKYQQTVSLDKIKLCVNHIKLEQIFLLTFCKNIYQQKYFLMRHYLLFKNMWGQVMLNDESSNDGLMMEFLKSPFLVLHFSYYKLMTFLMMLYVILLSMLMILLSSLNVIRHLICGNNQNWLLNMNMIYKTLWTWVGSGMLISILEKLNQFHLTSLKALVLLM